MSSEGFTGRRVIFLLVIGIIIGLIVFRSA